MKRNNTRSCHSACKRINDQKRTQKVARDFAHVALHRGFVDVAPRVAKRRNRGAQQRDARVVMHRSEQVALLLGLSVMLLLLVLIRPFLHGVAARTGGCRVLIIVEPTAAILVCLL